MSTSKSLLIVLFHGLFILLLYGCKSSGNDDDTTPGGGGGTAPGPLQCPPAVWEEFKLYASDPEENAFFGYAVDIYGFSAISSASAKGPGINGGVYFFSQMSNGEWNEHTKIDPSENTYAFGYKVSITHTHAAVSTKGGNLSNNINDFESGAVYIYKREPTAWKLLQIITPPTGEIPQEFEFGQFGYGLDMKGNRLAISDRVYKDKSKENGPGVVCIYELNPQTKKWDLQQIISPNFVDDHDLFGSDVSLSENMLLVGSNDNSQEGFNAGASYLFEYDVNTSEWTFKEKMVASDAEAEDLYGVRVALSSNSGWALNGAQWEDTKGSKAGAAYYLHKSPTGFEQKQKVMGSKSQTNDIFGQALDLDELWAVIGAPNFNEISQRNGYAYLYQYDDDCSWKETNLVPSDGKINDRFGGSVSIQSSTGNIMVAAPENDDKAENAGKVYIFNVEVEKTAVFPEFDLEENPWPYKYIYTGYGRTTMNTPIEFNMINSGDQNLTTEIGEKPSHGEIRIDQERQTITYIPENGYTGYDVVRLNISDGKNGRNQAEIEILVIEE